jgi:hypothetical protein
MKLFNKCRICKKTKFIFWMLFETRWETFPWKDRDRVYDRNYTCICTKCWKRRGEKWEQERKKEWQ